MSVRAFVAPETAPQPGETIELDADESRYLARVRRVRVGAAIELLDGRGGVWSATLVASDRRVRIEVGRAVPRDPSPGPPRVVLLGLPDPPATLDALAGACELGASELVLIRCERSQGQVPSRGRIERVLRASMRQCGRPSPPELHGGPPARPWSFGEALAHRPELPAVFGDLELDARASLPDLGAGVRVLVGPEGGLSPAEVEAARAAGFVGVRLGPWVLRTPTAVAAILALARTGLRR